MPEDDPTTYDSLIAQVAKAPDVAPGVAVGDVFGSYRIVAELGSGGMGSVYLAEHAMLGSRAAIKVLRPELSQQQQVVQRFFDEARAATRVADPGIVTVLDFGWHASGSAYLVMEHLSGETLSRRIHRLGYLPPSPALAILRQCAMAMAAAHARGIVHRDLKPDNIFIVPDPAIATERVKVLDFGIAKLLGDGDASHDGTVTGMILGTPGYMSPEQCRGAGKVDHRTDVYALGCVLFHMLCGRPPFIAPTPGDMIAAHLVGTPPVPSSLLPGIPPEVDALTLRCLEKDAAKRFQTMAELVAAIDALAGLSTLPPIATALALHTTRPAGPRALAEAGAQTAAAVAVASPTTLGSTSGQSIGPAARSRAGWIGIAVALATATVVVIALANRRGDRSAGRGAQAIDAAPMAAPVTPTPDAGPAGTQPDAAPAHDDLVAKDPRGDRPRDKPRGDKPRDKPRGDKPDTPGAGSGSAAVRIGGGSADRAGSGSVRTEGTHDVRAGSGGATRPGHGSASTGTGSASTGTGSSSGYDPYDHR